MMSSFLFLIFLLQVITKAAKSGFCNDRLLLGSIKLGNADYQNILCSKNVIRLFV